MYSTMFFPVVPFILHLVVVLWFALVALYLSSAGEKVYTINSDVSTLKYYIFPDDTKELFFFSSMKILDTWRV